MELTLTQIILLLFLLFAQSRVVLRFKSSELTWRGLIFWTLVFSSAIIVTLMPPLTSSFAKILGIGRGADAVVYTSIVLLFYLVFRLYIYIQDLRFEITELIKKIALKEIEEKHDRKMAKD